MKLIMEHQRKRLWCMSSCLLCPHMFMWDMAPPRVLATEAWGTHPGNTRLSRSDDATVGWDSKSWVSIPTSLSPGHTLSWQHHKVEGDLITASSGEGPATASCQPSGDNQQAIVLSTGRAESALLYISELSLKVRRAHDWCLTSLYTRLSASQVRVWGQIVLVCYYFIM